MKKKIKILIITLLVLVLSFVAILSLDILINRPKGVLNGVQFSGSYADRKGELLKIYLTDDESYRVYKSVTEYPTDFIEALLLQEDRKFYAHHGINPVSLIRAGFETYINHSRRIGASTITMQTAKLRYNLYTKNLGGKLLQIVLALRLELVYSKQQILDAYVNLAPCGKNIEGFEAASYYFFGKSIEQIDLSEKLLLCVLPQNPSKRCPSIKNIPDDLLNARSRLFEEWIKTHKEDSSLSSFINTVPQLVCRFPEKASHFTRIIELQKDTKKRYGIRNTTIDFGLQKIVEKRVFDYIRENNCIGINNAAVLLVDSRNMEVCAELGSAGFYKDSILGQIDGNLAKRSPGSTLKPFIYAMALEQGKIHYSTMLKDSPSSFSEYTPDNYGNTFKGPMKSWLALTESRNIPAVTLAREIKNPDLYDFLQNTGISDLKQKETYGLSIVLGSAEVTPFELTKLYGILVNDGVENDIKILQDGTTLGNEHGYTDKKILTPQSCFIVRKMLEQNPSPIEYRTREAKNTIVGYKTGTSIGFKDCWSVGYFAQYILCVWIGNFDGTGNNAFLGRSAAAPLFFNIADSIISGNTCIKKDDIAPDGVVQVDVCTVSGDLANENCPYTEKSWFIPGVSPIKKCQIHRKITIDTRTGYRTDEEGKPYCKTVVREFWPSDLMALFEQAGLPRLVPADYPPNEGKINYNSGYPPQIISPLAYTEYLIRLSDEKRKKIILQASADGDTSELFWFYDSVFICRCKPGEKYEWEVEPGVYDLSVIDNKGRSDSLKITVKQIE